MSREFNPFAEALNDDFQILLKAAIFQVETRCFCRNFVRANQQNFCVSGRIKLGYSTARRGRISLSGQDKGNSPVLIFSSRDFLTFDGG